MEYHITIPAKLIHDDRLRAQECTLFGILKWFHVQHGACRASNPVLAKMANCSTRGAQNSLTRLEKYGYIRKEFEGDWRVGKRNIITLEVADEPIELVCHYCKKPDVTGENLTEDHYQPKSKGGSNHKNNRVLACKPCNSQKGAKDAKDFAYHQ